MRKEPPQLALLRILAFSLDGLGLGFALILPASIISYAVVLIWDTTTAISTIWQVALALFGVAILARDSMGRSPGKKLLGLVIESPRGRTCGPIRSIIRNLTVLIPGINVIEFLILILTKNGVRLGDRLARTRIVQE